MQDRLTTHDPNRRLVACRANCEAWDAIYDRLAAYEDTGLEPEEVKSLKETWDLFGGADGIQSVYVERDKYKQAESEGRLIVLPSDPYEMADVAQEILSRACRLQREAEAALGGDNDA